LKNKSSLVIEVKTKQRVNKQRHKSKNIKIIIDSEKQSLLWQTPDLSSTLY
jgi:hypothetical protein